MKIEFWTLAHTLTKLPVIFDSGYPRGAAYEVTMRNLSTARAYNTRDEAVTELANFNRMFSNHPLQVGIMKMTVDLPPTVEMISQPVIERIQINKALSRLDKKEADLIRSYLK